MGFEFLEHTADIKIRARGKTLGEAFESVAAAFSNYVSRGEKLAAKKKKKILLEAIDQGNLLYSFIDELIYLMDAEHFVVKKARVKITETKEPMKLTAVLEGDDVKNYKDLDHAKAATYSEMLFQFKNSGWVIETVIDV